MFPKYLMGMSSFPSDSLDIVLLTLLMYCKIIITSYDLQDTRNLQCRTIVGSSFWQGTTSWPYFIMIFVWFQNCIKFCFNDRLYTVLVSFVMFLYLGQSYLGTNWAVFLAVRNKQRARPKQSRSNPIMY